MRCRHSALARIRRDLLTTFAAAALAAVPLPAGADPDRISVCFTDWPPYAYTRDGEAEGLSVQVIGEAARRAGLQASFAELPWTRCLKAVEQGDVHAALDGLPRPSLIHGATPHPVVVAGILVRAGTGRPVDGPEDLTGLVFAHPIGWAITPPLQAMIDAGSIELVRPVTRDQVVAMLKRGRADFANDAFAEFQRVARQADLEIVPVPGTVTATRMYPLFTPGRPDLRDRVDAALAGMAADGTLDGLFVEAVGIARSRLLESVPE